MPPPSAPAEPSAPPPARVDHGTTASPLDVDSTHMPVDLDSTLPPLEDADGHGAAGDGALADLATPTPLDLSRVPQDDGGLALPTPPALPISVPRDATSASVYITGSASVYVSGTSEAHDLPASPSGEAAIPTADMPAAPLRADLSRLSPDEEEAIAASIEETEVKGLGVPLALPKPRVAAAATPIEEAGARGVGSGAATHFAASAEELSAESADLVAYLTSKVAVERSRANEYYERGTSLARGGMGEIFLATDRYLKRELVMKLMLPGAQRDPVRVHRFVEEAQVTGQLEHPNIVPVHDLGVTAEGHLYFTMKRIQGDALSKIIDEIKAGTPRYARQYSLVVRLQLFRSICNALAFAHNKGVIHRDLKPENIMIGEFGEVYVMDWGLAKVQQADGDVEGAAASRVTSARAGSSSEVVHTAAGQVFGTPKYMAPEQARGENDRIDHRSDIYSAGAILYELLALRPPIESGSVFEIMIKVGEGDFVAPGDEEDDPDVPVELQAIVLKAMANDRAERYQSIGELVLDIDAYLGGRSVSAHQDSPVVVLVKWAKRNKAAAAAMAAGVLALVLGIVGMRAFSQAKVAQQAKGLLEQARSDRKAGRLREAQVAGYQALGLAPEDQDLKVELSAIGVAIGVHQREQDRLRALEAVRSRLKAEHDAAKAQAAPTPETRRRWYAYWNRALNTARDLARTTDGKDKIALATQCEIARTLARQFREDENYAIAETMIDEAEGAGLEPELIKLERFTLAEAKSKQLKLEQKVVLEMLAELRTRVPVEARHQQILAEVLKRPHPHVVQVLIPKVFSANAAERRLAVEALGQIGDAKTTSPVAIQVLPPADATSKLAAPEVDPDVATLHAEALREHRARWVAAPPDGGEAPKATDLDALQAVTLALLASPLAYEAQEELQRLAWALGRMRDGRAAEPLAIKRWAGGYDSTFWRRTAGAQALVPLPADAPAELPTPEAHARRALLRLAAGQSGPAKDDLDRALAREPTEARWLHWRALAQLALGARDLAKADATKARDRNPSAGRYATTLARIHDASGQRDLALPLLERPTTDVGGAFLLKGQLLQRAKSSALALVAFSSAIDADPRLSLAYLGRGQLQLDAGAPQPAALDLERAIGLEPEHARAHAELGRALLELGQLDGAFAELDRAIALDPDLWIAYHYRALCYQRAWDNAPTATRDDRRDRGRMSNEVLASLNKALALAPDEVEPRVLRARMHYARNHWTLATEDYDRALEHAPDFKTLWFERARTLYRYGDLDRATVDLDKAVEFEPNRDEVRLLRARVRRGKYRFDEAIADLDALVAKDPKNTDARFERALVYHRRGQVDAQLAQARLLILQQRAQRGDPGATPAEVEKARVTHEAARAKAKQDLERAIAELTQLATEQPQWPLALYYRGQFREENGDRTGRLEDFERAHAVSTPDWYERDMVGMYLLQTYYERGVEQAKAGNREAAKKDIRRALELAKEIGPAGGMDPRNVQALEGILKQLGE